jgi:hypothetical protein
MVAHPLAQPVTNFAFKTFGCGKYRLRAHPLVFHLVTDHRLTELVALFYQRSDPVRVLETAARDDLGFDD